MYILYVITYSCAAATRKRVNVFRLVNCAYEHGYVHLQSARLIPVFTKQAKYEKNAVLFPTACQLVGARGAVFRKPAKYESNAGLFLNHIN